MSSADKPELTPLTCDPELKRKWNRVLALERQLDDASYRIGRKIDELNSLKRELGIEQPATLMEGQVEPGTEQA